MRLAGSTCNGVRPRTLAGREVCIGRHTDRNAVAALALYILEEFEAECVEDVRVIQSDLLQLLYHWNLN